MTAAVDDVDVAFEAALAKDAGQSAPPQAPAPPRVDRDPKAPHGRAEDGTPNAPYGLKADGTPRIKPAGPGRPKEDAPRVTASAAAPAAGKSGGRDYAPGLMAAGESAWLVLALNQGFGVGKRKAKDGTVKPLIGLPDTRPYAAVFKQQLPLMAKTWSEAANQSAKVRQWVDKIAGDEEGVSWVLGVTVSSVMFLMGCKQLASAQNAEMRAQLAEKTDSDVQEFFQDVLAQIGAAS